jgi:hypothetical protein
VQSRSALDETISMSFDRGDVHCDSVSFNSMNPDVRLLSRLLDLAGCIGDRPPLVDLVIVACIDRKTDFGDSLTKIGRNVGRHAQTTAIHVSGTVQNSD